MALQSFNVGVHVAMYLYVFLQRMGRQSLEMGNISTRNKCVKPLVLAHHYKVIPSTVLPRLSEHLWAERFYRLF